MNEPSLLFQNNFQLQYWNIALKQVPLKTNKKVIYSGLLKQVGQPPNPQ